MIRSRLTIALVATLATTLLATSVEAQSFGRNKVQWEKFDFEVLATEHFDIYYYEEEEEAIQDIAKMAERWYSRLSTVFDYELPRKPIVIYADHPDFQQTTTTGGLIGEGLGGFTDSFKNRIVMPLTGSYADNDHVLGHEMVHVFQYDIAETLSKNRNARFQLQQLPLWMIEGLAEYLSQGRVDTQTSMWMRDAVLHDHLPEFDKLSRDPRLTPYQYGQAVWAYIGGRWGDAAVIQTFVASGVLGPTGGFLRVLDMTPDEVFEEWHTSTREAYQPILDAIPNVETFAEPRLTRETTRGNVNIAPSISPDGSRVAFLSTRDLFSIDLYLADARTGEVIRRLVSADADPHFDALRFLDSAGGWSPDGRFLAFVVFERGNNTIAITDVSSGKITRRIAVSAVGSITNPVWSPDGSTIAFSGSRGGITDLYLLDTDSGAVTQLTNDRYANLQPSWSPDGSTLAYVTDEGPGTDLDELTFHPMRIAVMDVRSRDRQLLATFGDTRHTNPQYSPNGELIYMIADPDGIANVYAYSTVNGSIRRVTNVQTGVSGITDLSPAITVAAKSGDLMFSIFTDSDWDIYAIDADSIRPEQVTLNPSGEPELAEILPPSEAVANTSVEAYLARPSRGLDDSPVLSQTSYSPRLSLDYVGPPALGVGSDQFGIGLSGAISAYFSDVLGRHQLGVAVQTSGSSTESFTDQIGARVQYLNQSNRINWGASLTHVPQVYTSTARDVINIDGQLFDAILQRRRVITIDDASLISQLPLSLTRRLEAEVGYQNYGYSDRLFTYVLAGNAVVDILEDELQTLDSISFARASAAFVGDSTSYGFISPVRGTRYRMEYGYNTGDIDFSTALADYRKYMFFRPVTFAFRGLHYGRYGDGAEDQRLSQLFIGYRSLVRGYDTGSFNVNECSFDPANPTGCPEFDRLLGSKIGVASAEVRAPLFGNEDYGLFKFEFLPTELYGFVDGGVAWTEDEDATFEFNQDTIERVPVFSAGVGARMVLGGYLPLDFYYVFPFQRPEENGYFGWAIQVGW